MRPLATNFYPRASCPWSRTSFLIRRASSNRATTNPPASSPHPHPLHQWQWQPPSPSFFHPHTHLDATPVAWHARKDLKANAPQEHSYAHSAFSQQSHTHELPEGWHTPAGAVHPHSHLHSPVDTRVHGPDMRIRGPDIRVRGPGMRGVRGHGQHTLRHLWHAQAPAANWPHSIQWPSSVVAKEQTGLLSILRSAFNLAWRVCRFFWLPRYFSKAQTSAAPSVDGGGGMTARLPAHTGAPPGVITPTSDSIQTSSQSPPVEKKKNGLTFALTTLSSVIASIPGVSVLNSFIVPLMNITERIEQTSANEEQLNALATRIARLAPIISGIAEKNPQHGESFVQALQSELQSITKDLEAARSRGKLDQFFDGADSAAAIHKHQANLSRLITDYTLVAVISNSGQELERSKLPVSSPSQAS